MSHTLDKSLDYWNKYGQYLLMATAYQDHVLQEAQGCMIRDVDGNELFDLESGQICSILGHGHQKLVDRLHDQMHKLMHIGTGFMCESTFEAARKIAEVAPGNLKKSLILSTGAEANEAAFRIARVFTGRQGIAGFDQGYSGLTLQTKSVGGNSNDTSVTAPGNFKILTPDCPHCPVRSTYPACDFLCIQVSERMLRNHCENKIAAMIVEPILSAGGMIVPPDGYFQSLKKMSARLGILLIADEAQTGMGRTGRWFGLDHDQVVPDILVMSKGVGGGFPASAVVVQDKIAKGILGRFRNFSSHQSDPLAAAAISAVIDILRDESLLKQAEETGKRLKDGLQELSTQYDLIGHIRGKGLMIGMDALAFSKKGLQAEAVGSLFEALCRQENVHMKSLSKGRIFRILPPLTITMDQIEHVLQVFESVLNRIHSGQYDLSTLSTQNAYTKQLHEQSNHQLTWKKMLKKGWETPPSVLAAKVRKKLRQD